MANIQARSASAAVGELYGTRFAKQQAEVLQLKPEKNSRKTQTVHFYDQCITPLPESLQW